MTARTFRHALTGRSLRVLPGSRNERLVEADENWSEVKAPAKKTAAKKASSSKSEK